jgi:hypothetical protein
MREKAPLVRMVAKVSPDGVIEQTIRGNNFVLEDPENWHEVTDDKRVLELFGIQGQKKLLICKHKKCLVDKPKVTVKVDKEIIEAGGKDKAKVTFEVEGDPQYIPDKIKVQINSRTEEVTPGETIMLSSDVVNNLGIRVMDEKVCVNNDKPIAITAVHKDA